MSISVIICTHDPKEHYLRRALAALRGQSLAASRWELVVVDNASRVPVAGRFDVAWHDRARVIREEALGLTPARLRGIRESSGELLVFVDDDNFLDPDYLAEAQRIASDHSFVGAWSGQCRPEFDELPPEWTRRYWGNLVLRELDRDVWSNLPHLPETMPCGAGLCVRRAVAQAYLRLYETGARGATLDRVGGMLTSAGDNDLAACACDLGLGVGLFRGLRLVHKIPPERLTEEYLVRLADGVHYSGVIFRSLRGAPIRQPSLLSRAANLLRSYRLPQPHRRIFRASYKAEHRAGREIGRPPKIG